MSTPDFTENEAAVVLAALDAYREQTRQYLRSAQSALDDCFDTARARRALREQGLADLQQRLRFADAAIMEMERAK